MRFGGDEEGMWVSCSFLLLRFTNFSSPVDNWVKERDRLQSEMSEAREAASAALAKWNRLEKQMSFHEKRREEMVARELASIEEMERLEEEQERLNGEMSAFDLPSFPDDLGAALSPSFWAELGPPGDVSSVPHIAQ